MTKYGQRICQIVHPAQPDPNCLCRFTRCDKGPYCEVVRLAERAVVSSRTEGGPGLSESDALLLAFDKMAAWHREQARAAGTAPETLPVQQPPQFPPVRRKRRTKQQMAEARAAQAARIQESYHSLVPAEARAWLDEPDPMLQQILEAPHDRET